jgi:hypothetical protein
MVEAGCFVRTAGGRGAMPEKRTETLGEALPREMERVRAILPYYDETPTGAFAATMMRQSLSGAKRALVEGDVAKMVRYLEELKGYEA